MRIPDIELDGWGLGDGEQWHREFPKTFEIPDLALRKILRPGDLAKLMFRISIQNEAEEEVERMWVIIRERTADGYIGMLYNKPSSIPENGRLWFGTELLFEYRHIIAAHPPNEESPALAKAPVPIP